MYVALSTLSYSLSCLPKVALDGVARILSAFIFDILRFRRALILKNIKIAFGEKYSAEDRVRLGRASVYHFALTMLETLVSVRKPIAADVSVEGERHLREALAQGKGAYILCFHMGNWEAMAAKMTQSIVPSYVLVKKIGSPGVQRWVEETRQRNDFRWIKREKKGDGFRGIREVLSRGEAVGFAFDQTRPGEPRLPFFGHPAKTNTSLAAIWRRYPAPIIPAYIQRESFGVHTLKFFPEVKLTVSENLDADILTHSQQFNQVLEELITQCPEQYFWLHNRWKS